MAHWIDVTTFSDERGRLNVLEDFNLPFPIKRAFFIHGVDPKAKRGGHKHYRLIEALICVSGRCTIETESEQGRKTFILDDPGRCLILEPSDWRRLYDFTADAVLMVLASENFDPSDYIWADETAKRRQAV